ncbi:PREDICTED: profilin isoform X3 [Branchiostoma belcheri]|uniref:Profilin n=2 Tax=Branchiostoma belcheri TaxID=7741 RepID=A0A6P4ZD96_BRABE|nr:PREDICTED: profilin isoform X1 [Branchiostoma belcheri]XP_019629094.1 PREDICTED: profilin isoform X3 [Branchiostoma belcheri]
MSWQQYVDQHLVATQCVTMAAICGLDGSIWAKSSGLELSQDEVAALARSFSKDEVLAANGIRIGGTKYIYLSGDDKLIRGKKDRQGVHIVKTKTAMVMALYAEPILPEQCAVVVEKLGDWLIQNDL